MATDAVGKLSIAAQFRVRQVNPVNGLINTIAGGNTSEFSPDGFPAVSTSFHGITELAADPAGNVFVFEGFSNEPRFVRRIDALSGLVSTVAGGGTNAPGTGVATNMQFIDMFDIAVSAAGELFIAMNFQLFRIDLTTGLIAPIAGDGIQGYSGDGGSALSARFSGMSALAVIPGGGIVVADSQNFRLRYIAPNSINLTNDNGQTFFTLPWVSALTGNLILENNPNLTNINVGTVTNVGGVVSIGGNTAAGVLDLGSLETSGNLVITDNTAATVINLSSLTTVTGDLVPQNNWTSGNLDLGSLSTVSGDLTIEEPSSGNLDLGSLAEVSGDLTLESNESGNLDLSSLTEYGCGTNEVTMTLEGGTFGMTNGLTLCTNATLTGSTTVDGSITNNGTIEPGSSPGRLNITGNLHLGSASRLRMEIGGYASNQFDLVNVGNSVRLGGTLTVTLLNSFTNFMTNGASFTVLTAGAPLAGSFANVASGGTLVTADGRGRFTVRYAGENTLRLTNLEILNSGNGDTDGDGLPDEWEDRFGLDKTNAADAELDLDGDLASNANEFAAGTDPANPASVLRLMSIQKESNRVRLTWSAVGGKTYRVQTNGMLPGGFADNGTIFTAPGTGAFVTNLLSSDVITNKPAGYYRLRLGP